MNQKGTICHSKFEVRKYEDYHATNGETCIPRSGMPSTAKCVEVEEQFYQSM
jgi:hypothetical protein